MLNPGKYKNISNQYNNTNIARNLHKIAEGLKKKGLIILISDLFDKKEDVISSLKHFRYKGHEVIVFHILDEQELNLDFDKPTKFQDMETNKEIITEPWHIKKDYQNKIHSFCNFFKNECRKHQID